MGSAAVPTGEQVNPMDTGQPISALASRHPPPPASGAAGTDDSDLLLRLVERAMIAGVPSGGRLDQALRYHLASGGKRLRARLALACGQRLGVRQSQLIAGAAACELAHQASLVHDDLQDDDPMRRGMPTVWRHFDRHTALCLGDTMIARAHARCADTGIHCARILRLLGDAVGQAAAGQVQEGECPLQQAHKPLREFAIYEGMARGKSGALLALPVQIAAALGDADDAALDAIGEALGAWGIAYQIKDDLEDCLGFKEGRAAGNDLVAGQMNAVVVCHLATGNAALRRQWQDHLHNPPPAGKTMWLRRLWLSPAPADAVAWGRAQLQRGIDILDHAAAHDPLVAQLHPVVVATIGQRLEHGLDACEGASASACEDALHDA
jgi:geranylgeranyl pyrophosphate synthase